MVVFPAPPFGHIDRMTRVASTVSSLGVECAASRPGGVEDALERIPELVVRRAGSDHVAGAGVQRGLQEIVRRLGHDHGADVRSIVVDRGGELERPVRRDARPDGDDFCAAVPKLFDHPGRLLVQQSFPPVPQLTVETALERGPHSLLEVRVGCRQHELGHGLSRLRPVVPTSSSRGPGMRVSTALRSGLSRMRRERVRAARRGRWLSGRSRCRRRGSACGRQRSSYSAITIGAAFGPHAGQLGSRRTLKLRNDSSSASYASRRPTSGSPRSSSSLIASSAWIDPMMPGSTPSTPASAQLGASSGGGGSGSRQR